MKLIEMENKFREISGRSISFGPKNNNKLTERLQTFAIFGACPLSFSLFPSLASLSLSASYPLSSVLAQFHWLFFVFRCFHAAPLNRQLLTFPPSSSYLSVTFTCSRLSSQSRTLPFVEVVQEKNRLLSDLKRLKKHYEQYEPTLTELRHKSNG